jgi:hypothetical protein
MRSILLLATVTVSCAALDASPTSIELACESHGTEFPSLDKACVQATDCFIADHTVSCCGTMIADGFNTASEAAFAAAETTCAAAYPGCDCVQDPTTAEDGRTDEMGTIAVGCDMGLCRTYVP